MKPTRICKSTITFWNGIPSNPTDRLNNFRPERNKISVIMILFLIGSSFVFSSCWFMGPSVKGNGKVTKEVRTVDEFDQIKVNRGMNAYITQGSPAEVVVIADNNLHETITTEVEGGVLTVSVNENIRWAKEKKVMITVEKLKKVEVSSGANAWSQNRIMSKSIDLKASSGANLTMELNCENLSADCSSGANIFLSGIAAKGYLEASSGSNVKGKNLVVEDCRMKASSGANVSATVTNRLDAKASSGGNVMYFGEPATTEINSSSGGNIIKQ